MTKRKDKVRAKRLYGELEKITTSSMKNADPQNQDSTILNKIDLEIADSSRSLRLKRFRLQLLHQWLTSKFLPCRVADIGGGKGLLSYLLINSGWDAVVIDPNKQSLPNKYKDIKANSRVKISEKLAVPYLVSEFKPEMAKDFDLLIAMHAHGCNAKIIDAAALYSCGFVIFPCCVVDEPIYPQPGEYWIESIATYALQKGLIIHQISLNFKGQNIGFYSLGNNTKLL